jgi:hypothetical protein
MPDKLSSPTTIQAPSGDKSGTVADLDALFTSNNELLLFVKDLQTRLEQTQWDLRSTKTSLNLFEGKHLSLESGLNATRSQLGAYEGRAQSAEKAYSSFDRRANDIEKGLRSLWQIAEQKAGTPLPSYREMTDPASSGRSDQDLEARIQKLRQESKDLESKVRGGVTGFQPGGDNPLPSARSENSLTYMPLDPQTLGREGAENEAPRGRKGGTYCWSGNCTG